MDAPDSPLTPRQLDMLEFLREYERNNGGMPRLNAITEHFAITNKAAYDILDALQKKRRITKEGDVQNIKILPSKDIFISYSSKDKATAERIRDAFHVVGYTVWMDDIDIHVGEDIVDKVFRGIREARFFVVLLSENSVRSNWVQNEISNARLHEIESKQIVVLPVIIDEHTQPPASLASKKYVKISQNTWQDGMRRLLESIVYLSLNGSVAVYEEREADVRSADIDEKKITDHVKEKWPKGKPMKEWIIHPVPFENKKIIRKGMIEEFVEQNRIKLQGWGGTGFPHPTHYSRIEDKSNVDAGFYMYWMREADGMFTKAEEYVFWGMLENGLLVSRETLREDASYPELKILSLEWLEMDIVTPMLFIRKMLRAFPEIKSYRLTFRFTGLKDRQLYILNTLRSGFDYKYIAKEDSVEMAATIDDTTDLLETALEMTLNIVELFNWTRPNTDILKTDLKEFLSGKYPR